jgi:hypothetical protein
MDAREIHSNKRYIILALLALVIVSLAFPALDAMSALGFAGDKTYLLILQDNSEIQNTGGLLGCLGLVTVHDGSIKELNVYYTLAYLNRTVKLEGPESVSAFFGQHYAEVAHSNVQYDFASFAPIMQSNFCNLTGAKVDGTIGIDFTAIEELLKVTGPMHVSGEIITSWTVVNRINYYSASPSVEKAPLTHLLSELGLKIGQTMRDASLPQKLTYASVLRQLASQKHVQLYLKGDALTRDFAGAWIRPRGDFIYAVDTNLGAGKADFGINRTIDDDVMLLADGSSISNLKLTYTNNNWWDYNVFTTVLVPPGATLLDVTYTAQSFARPLAQNGTDFTAFSAHFGVVRGATGTVTFTYALPKQSHSSGIGSRYDLYINKQAGISEYRLNTKVTPPVGTEIIAAQNLGSSGPHAEDTHVQMVYAKKGPQLA